MEYFRLLHLNKEPFSNSPEPDFFYQSTQHVECLQKLELAIRLRRGLNVVIGDVGTGKTTLCRQLIRRLDGDEKIKSHLLLDPHFSKPIEFLTAVAALFGLGGSDMSSATEWQLRELIKNYLFDEGVKNSNCIVLIIDEGQKIPDFCIEMLREFLNFETNEYKLLQIVIFAQQEFTQNLERNPGFADRINMSWRLGPLGFKEASNMIRFRLEMASAGERKSAGNLFSLPALFEIYRTTGGYPRKIVILCHQIILTLIVQNKVKANWRLVHTCIRRGYPEAKVRRVSYAPALAVTGAVIIIFALMLMPERPINVTVSDSGNIAPVMKAQSPARNVQEPIIKETFPARVPVLNASEITEERALSHYPPLLGTLHVKRKNTVWAMVEDVYGECTIALIQAVAARNPQIRDLDYIYEGDIISLPAVAVNANALHGEKGYWIQIAERTKLDEAYAMLKNTVRADLPQLQLVSYWNEERGLCFSLLLKMRFQDEAEVRTAMEKLPGDISADARVMSGWDDQNVVFSRLPS